MTLEKKLIALYQLRNQKRDQDLQVKNTEALIEQAQLELVDEFESREIKSMKLDGVGNFVLRVSSYPKVSDVSLLRTWMATHEVPWETVTALHAKKFQGWYNELVENGEPLPEGCENFTKAGIAITPEKG